MHRRMEPTLITSHCPSPSPDDLISPVSLVLHLLHGNARSSKEKSSKQAFFCQASENRLENQRGFPCTDGGFAFVHASDAAASTPSVGAQPSPAQAGRHCELGDTNCAAQLPVPLSDCCTPSNTPEQVILWTRSKGIRRRK